jgi:hypothetical protein
LRHDGGSVERLIDTSADWFTRADEITGAFESKQPGRIVIQGVSSLHEIEMHPGQAGFSPFRTSTLFSYSSSTPWFPTLLTGSGEYLLFNRPSWFSHQGLERLEQDGRHEVSGDPVPPLPGESWQRPWMSESAALKVGADPSQQQLVFLRPQSVPVYCRIITWDVDSLAIPTDMPSIGKTAIKTSHGLFEFTMDRRLIPLPVPFSSDMMSLSDFSAAHTALIATKGQPVCAFSIRRGATHRWRGVGHIQFPIVHSLHGGQRYDAG